MRCVLRIDPAAETLEAALVLDRYRACSTLFMFVGRPRQVRVLGLSVLLGDSRPFFFSPPQFRVSSRVETCQEGATQGDRHSEPPGAGRRSRLVRSSRDRRPGRLAHGRAQWASLA